MLVNGSLIGKDQRMKRFVTPPCALAVVIGMTAACKPEAQKSDLQSLDNFTAEEGTAFTFNSCSGSYKTSAPDNKLVASANEQAAIRSALSAVPVELQDAFFETLNGKIAVVKDIGTSCQVPAGSNATDATLSCWQPGTDNTTIFIKSEASEADTIRNIRHSVVRAMGYVLTDIILKIKQTPEGTKLERNEAFETVKAELTEALVSDLKKTPGYKLPALYSTDRNAFSAAAFAESFDSWYCSTASKNKMQTAFPKTYKYFAGIADILPAGLSGQMMAETQPEEGDGLSLWGRWGAGNGPLRQGLSNWGGFRANGGGLVNFRRFNSGGGLIFRRPWFNPARWG